MQGNGVDHLCSSLSVLPAANLLLRSPPSLLSSLSVLAELSASEGASQDVGTSALSQLPPRAQVPSQFFSFVLSSYVEIFLAILGV